MKKEINFLIILCLFVRCAYDPAPMHPDGFAIISEKNISAKLGDSVSVSVSVTQPLSNLKFLWSIDGSLKEDTTYDSCFCVQWFAPDTASHTVVVRAIDRYGWVTPAETVFVSMVYAIPEVSIKGPDSLSINDTAVFTAHSRDDDGVVEKYLWSIDPDTDLWFAGDSVMIYSWKKDEYGMRTVRVRAVDNSGLLSKTDSILVKVCENAPAVVLNTHDTIIYTNQELKLHAHAFDLNGTIERFEWTVRGELVDSVSGDSITLSFRNSQTASDTVIVTVTDSDSLQVSDTVFVTVKKPQIRLSVDDTVMHTGEELVLVAESFPPDDKFTEYQWFIDGVLVKNLKSDTLRRTWRADETGVHTIIVSGFNEKKVSYEPDTAVYYVKYGAPEIVSLNDTAISSDDTLILKFSAFDNNGTVEKYLWGPFNEGWTDSSDLPEAHIVYRDSRDLVLVWGARDNNQLISKDTVRITFNRPPILNVLSPVDNDTVWLGEKKRCDTVLFDFGLTDPDNDSLSISVYWGTEIDSMQPLYPGSDEKYRAVIDRKGVCHWSISIRDSFGNVVSQQGILTALFQYTVCFAGHSIVAGMGGDHYHGGFRKYVIDSLRNSLNEFETIKAVGPLVTSYMSGVDDSCFAYPKSVAEQMQVLMKGCPDLTADIWVWMMGTNSLESYGDARSELQYFVTLLDYSYTRNPDARIYVCNCIPFEYDTDINGLYQTRIGFLDYFNRNLSYRINSLRFSGYDIFEVDANRLWMNNENLPDSALYYDPVHPNQNGYEKLGKEILRVMWSSVPGVIPEIDIEN